MPTGRLTSGAVYTNNTLVVAEGSRDSNILTTVEILNTVNIVMQWYIVSSIPVPINHQQRSVQTMCTYTNELMMIKRSIHYH